MDLDEFLLAVEQAFRSKTHFFDGPQNTYRMVQTISAAAGDVAEEISRDAATALIWQMEDDPRVDPSQIHDIQGDTFLEKLQIMIEDGASQILRTRPELVQIEQERQAANPEG